MTTYVFRDDRLVLKGSREDVRPQRERSHLPAPYVVSDQLHGLQSMVDGQYYDSKSALRASYHEHGVEELGNDAPTTPAQHERPGLIREDVEQAMAMVSAGYKPEALETTIIPEARS